MKTIAAFVTGITLATAGAAFAQTPDEWAALLARVTGIEAKNMEQDNRIAALEGRANVMQGDINGVWTWADAYLAYQLPFNDRSLRFDRQIAACAARREAAEKACLMRVVRRVSYILRVGGFGGIGMRDLAVERWRG